MNVTLQTNPKDLGSIPKKMSKELQDKYKSAFFRVAQVGINIILDRTSRGVSYKGGAFRPYSEKYAAFRTEKGASVTPNLNMSGKMLAAITSRASSKQAEIFFSKASESAKASKNDKSRPFFGFNREEEGRLARAFERFIR